MNIDALAKQVLNHLGDRTYSPLRVIVAAIELAISEDRMERMKHPAVLPPEPAPAPALRRHAGDPVAWTTENLGVLVEYAVLASGLNAEDFYGGLKTNEMVALRTALSWRLRHLGIGDAPSYVTIARTLSRGAGLSHTTVMAAARRIGDNLAAQTVLRLIDPAIRQALGSVFGLAGVELPAHEKTPARAGVGVGEWEGILDLDIGLGLAPPSPRPAPARSQPVGK